MSEQNSGFGRDVRFPKPRQTKRRLPSTKTQVLLGIAALLVLALAAWAIVASILPTEGMKQEASYDACVEDALSQLRDPSSAEFELAPGSMENDEGETVYTFDGHVRSRNGFGGMNSNTMACLGRWDDNKGEAAMKAIILPS